MNTELLKKTASEVVAKGKGIIAADESSGTCQKRFDSVGVECNEENRRLYRQTILSAPDLEKYVSGIILFDETIRQKNDAGERFPDALAARGILPGIKVDGGAKELALHEGEKVTEGLDGLRERLAEYVTFGAKFAKWRSVITIGANIPSEACIHANAHAMARYAALCQEAGIVPIVEPEVIIDGDHSIERCYEVTVAALKDTFNELKEQDVMLEGAILKASMVIAGKKAAAQSSPEQVGAETVKALLESVPKNLAGVVFLSGGQGDEQATANLNAMNLIGGTPWPLTFSYSRAIQNPVLKIWAQDTKGNVGKAQDALVFRSKMNSLASEGKYTAEMENERPY
ncbi:fructose-bisphosphate aldolase class I [Candidatus Kaiserbacteria bacterium]|nr:fructose-bisphosphate aldolase class I [Candidatus Kaiserbacteria bacterium]